ncbi:MAG: DEAD/DEAH box helicase [Bacteroidota bacterium]
MTGFNELNLNKALLNAINDLEIDAPTPIQEQSFSVIMSGKDVLGIAQTGTGKTYAYLLPCLRQWVFTGTGSPQILIIVPTRELVVQVVQEVEKLAKYMSLKVLGVYGGVNINTQSDEVYKGMDVLVATPGRLFDLIMRGVVRLKSIKKLVIDEVDEMLDLGFRHQLISIFDLLPPKRQNIMFSATMTKDIDIMIKKYFTSPQKIQITDVGLPLENINQKGYHVPNFNTKTNLLELLLQDEEITKVLVFVSTKKTADALFLKLSLKFPNQLAVIHSNKAQNKRFKAVVDFNEGDNRILIATDILARGLDFSDVSHVINFDMPDIQEDYIHRIGRTGRAEKKGESISLIVPSELPMQEEIEKLMATKIPMVSLPENLVISNVLTADEKPKINMKNIVIKQPKVEEVGAAFHEKSEKNKKVNNKIRRKDQMRLKYGKPKSRGEKRAKKD